MRRFQKHPLCSARNAEKATDGIDEKRKQNHENEQILFEQEKRFGEKLFRHKELPLNHEKEENEKETARRHEFRFRRTRKLYGKLSRRGNGRSRTGR